MTENGAGRVIALMTETQHVLGERLRPVQVAAKLVIKRYPMRNPEEFRGRTQLLPELSRAGMGMARFCCAVAFDEGQSCTQRAARLELPSPAIGAIGQQRQLVQSLLQLCRRLRHRRAG